MATSSSNWSDSEQKALLKQLVEAQLKMDIADTYAMGYLVLRASQQLTRAFGRTVTREDVVTEILHLKDRFANFVRYCGLPGVSYCHYDNKVEVTAEYGAGGRRETWRMLGYRLRGEECYRDLREAFLYGRADVADFDWLLRSFTGEEDISLPGDNPWPIHHTGIAEELENEGLNI